MCIRDRVGTHLRLHLLVGQEGLTGVGVQNVKGDGLALAAAAIVHLLQYPHQQHRAVAALKGIGIAEGAVRLALDDAAAGQLGHRLLAEAVHPPPVRQGCGINRLIPERGGIFLRQGVAEHHGLSLIHIRSSAPWVPTRPCFCWTSRRRA